MDKPSEIPKNVLDRINEHTMGGFILFYIDSQGNPAIVDHCDNAMANLALQNHILIYGEAVHNASVQLLSDMMIGEEQDDEENFIDEDDEEEK